MIESRELEQRLAGLGRPRVAIVGDLILDRYVTGDVARISPEAPIPVLTARSSELRLGGAGNVASNLRSMQAEVDIVGVVGDDDLGAELGSMLSGLGAGVSGLVVDPQRPTIEKTRMLSGVHQMLRVDWEDTSPLGAPRVAALVAAAERAIDRADAVVLSDYGKGVLAQDVLPRAIEAARKKRIPCLVDPKREDFRAYRGATLITPNRKEAEAALGSRIARLDELPAAADELIRRADLESIVITLGPEGMYYRMRDGREGRAPAQARAVFDVTGAGDTVVAHLALYLADGFDMETAIALANHAAGIVVGRLGTYSVTRAELAARLSEQLARTGKLVDEASLALLVENWRANGRRIVFTNGCFDVLHAGHIDYLRFARSKGDVLIVGVNDDASVRRLKGEGRPVNALADRTAVLSALEMIDAVVPFGEDTPARLIERITPHVLVKGEDWKDKGVVGREWVETHGGEVVLAPLLPGRSTSDVIARGKLGQRPAAAEGRRARSGGDA